MVVLDVGHQQLIARLRQRRREGHRTDDDGRVLQHRIDEYEHKTRPLLDYYQLRDLLLRVDAAGESSEVSARLFEALDRRLP